MTDREMDIARILQLNTRYSQESKDIVKALRQHQLLVNAVEGFLLGCEVGPSLDGAQVVMRASSTEELVSLLRSIAGVRRPELAEGQI
jgi:hypothetical protein